MPKAKNFLSIVDGSNNRSAESANFAPDTGQGNNASVQLINQLRDFIVAPSIQMNEMRFIEMLNVMEDHRSATERRFDKVERHLTEAADKATVMTFNIENHDEEIKALRQKVTDELHSMRAQQQHFMEEMRHMLDHSSRQLFDELSKRAGEFEAKTHAELRNMSDSLAGHVSNVGLRLEEERHNTAEMLGQITAQWRAERESERREDLEKLASSMMDIGRRLMAPPQPHA